MYKGYSTVLILIFFISCVLYILGILSLVSNDAQSLLAYIFEIVFALIVLGCIVEEKMEVKEERR